MGQDAMRPDPGRASALRSFAPRIRIWSRFSEEKQLDFNGAVIAGPEGVVLVDPVAMEPADVDALRREAPAAILLTNKDHRRASPDLKEAFGGIPIWVHEADRPLLEIAADRTYGDGDRLPGGLLAVHLPHLKSPGESAFYLPDDGALILGDALIGKPAGSLSLLPPAKVPDPGKARDSLSRLMALAFDTLVLGDGPSFPTGGRAALERFLQA